MLIFKTLTAAAIAALHVASFQTKVTAHEFAGAILQTPNGYVFTAPQEGDEYAFRLVVSIPNGDKLVGLYHTHPLNNDGDETRENRFSQTDVAVATKLNVASFIWVQSTNQVHEFIPGQSAVASFGDWCQNCSIGNVVAKE